jgi:hypothetical protein
MIMNKHNIEKRIPQAITVLREHFGDDPIPKVYQGYISAFGVSLVQTDLLPTLAFFGSASQNGDGDRSLISSMIAKTLGIETNGSLLDYAISHNDRASLKEEIKEASVALKLSMRLFVLEKGGAS